MRVTTLVLVSFAVGFACLLFIILNVSTAHPSLPTARSSEEQQLNDLEQLMHIISSQNETLYALKHTQNGQSSNPDTKHLFDVISSKDAEISRLNEELRIFKLALKEKPAVSVPIRESSVHIAALPTDTMNFLDVRPTQMDDYCEPRFGLELIEKWRNSEQTWCASESGGKIASSLKCYPYKQAHKNDKDMFCEATNFIIDFSKVSGNHGSSKPPRGDQYLSFAKKSILSSCKKTSKFNPRLFMPHNSRQMRDFEGNADPAIYNQVIVQETPVYLLARDEDCENSFHTTADFMNMYLVLSALRIHPSDLQVMLYDKHTNGPYYELIKKAFSPKNPIIRHGEFSGAKVMFKKLIFHLESPAGLIFPKVSNPDPLRCRNTGLFHAYRKHILESFDLWDVPAPPIPAITLSLRHRTSSKNVGRIMANEDEVIKAVKAVNVAKVQVVDTAKMSFTEQLSLIRHTNVLIGIHGAGLMFIMFAAEEAILIEVHPTYRQDRHFRHAARMTGKIYMPLRANKRETCKGSSDNVFVPIDEFEKTLDGAVRIARNFDDGLSECGAQCPYGILGLDKRLRDYYSSPGNARPINTRFPCA